MNSRLTRRLFIRRASTASVALTMLPHLSKSAEFRGKIRKAKIIGEVTEARLKPLKEASFDGVETTHICPESEAEKGRAVAGGQGGGGEPGVWGGGGYER